MNSLENQPKPKGGKRPGAGRKPSTLKGVLRKLPCYSAEIILHEINAQSELLELLRNKDRWLRFSVLKFLWEQAYGKAKQPVEQSGTLTHEHVNLNDLTESQLDAVAGLVESAIQRPSGHSE